MYWIKKKEKKKKLNKKKKEETKEEGNVLSGGIWEEDGNCSVDFIDF